MRVNRTLGTGAYSERELYKTGAGQRKSQLTEGFSCAVCPVNAVPVRAGRKRRILGHESVKRNTLGANNTRGCTRRSNDPGVVDGPAMY